MGRTATRFTLVVSMVKQTNKQNIWLVSVSATTEWVSFNHFLQFWNSPRFRQAGQKVESHVFYPWEEGERETLRLTSCTEMLQNMTRAFSKERGRLKAGQTKTEAHYKLSTAFKKTLLYLRNTSLVLVFLILPCAYKDSLHFLALVLRYFQFACQCVYSFHYNYFFSFIFRLNFCGEVNLCRRILS